MDGGAAGAAGTVMSRNYPQPSPDSQAGPIPLYHIRDSTTTQGNLPEKSRRPTLPTSVVAAYASGVSGRLSSGEAPQRAGGFLRGVLPGPPGFSVESPTTPVTRENQAAQSQGLEHRPGFHFKYEISQPPGVKQRQQPPQSPADAQLSARLAHRPEHQQQNPLQAQPRQLQQPRDHMQQQQQPQNHQLRIPPPPRRRPTVSTVPSPTTLISPTHPDPTRTPPVHPVALKLASQALSPIQHLYENAWFKTVTSVQHEVSRLHAELTSLVDAERNNASVMCAERDAALEEVKRLRKENGELKEGRRKAAGAIHSLRQESEMAVARVNQLKEDGERAAAHVQRLEEEGETLSVQREMLAVENEALKAMQCAVGAEGGGEQRQKELIDSRMDAMRAELREQYEARMAAALREIQEQKTLRIQAEKKLVDAMNQLKGITDRVFSTPPTDGALSASLARAHHDRRDSDATTLVGTPETETPKIQLEHPTSHAHVLKVTADQDRVDHVAASRPASRGPATPHLGNTSSPRFTQDPVGPTRLDSENDNRDSGNDTTFQYPSRPGSPEEGQDWPDALSRSIAQPFRSSVGPSRGDSNPGQLKRKDSIPLRLNIVTSGPGNGVLEEGSQFVTSPLGLEVGRESRPASSSSSPQISVGQQHSSPTPGARYPAPSLQNTDANRFRPPVQPTANNDRPKKRDRREFEGGVSEEYQRHPTRDDSNERSRPRLRRIDDGEVSVKKERAEDGEQGGAGTKGAARADESAGPSNTAGRVRPTPKNKIGINHMDLLYETRGSKMVCRMCRSPGKDAVAVEGKQTVVTFSTKASWAELVGHYQAGHPKAWEDLERRSPSQVAELRQRMASGHAVTLGLMLK